MQIRLLFFFLMLGATASAQQHTMLVGTYNSTDSFGIHVVKFNSDNGKAEIVNSIKTSNPSYLAVSPDKKYVYAVNENNADIGGKVVSFSFDRKTATLSRISSQSSGGVHPCYVAVDPKEKWVLAGNYSSGNLSLLPVKKGIVGKPVQVVQHEGNGPDTSRQKSPHVHGVFIKPKSQYVYVTDLGTDKVMQYVFNKKTGKLTPAKIAFFSTGPGSGPRHLDFHPNGKYVYVLNELTNAVSVWNDMNGDWSQIQSLSSLPITFKGKSTAADIHVSPDGKFLYCSNRGTSNSIAIFSIDKETGKISLVGHESTQGETPRNFNFDPTGNYLIVANQNSNNIVILKRDKETGLLTDTGNRINIDKPVCIKWIE